MRDQGCLIKYSIALRQLHMKDYHVASAETAVCYTRRGLKHGTWPASVAASCAQMQIPTPEMKSLNWNAGHLL